VSTADWVDPSWRHQISNTVLTTIVAAFLGGVGTLIWQLIKRVPKMTFLAAVLTCAICGALVGTLGGSIWWIFAHRDEPVKTEAEKPRAQPTPEFRVKYTATEIVQYADFSVIKDEIPTGLPSSVSLGGEAALHVLMGSRKSITMILGPTYFDPQPKANDKFSVGPYEGEVLPGGPNKNIVIANFVAAQGPHILFDLGKHTINTIGFRVTADGPRRLFRVTLFSISPRPYGKDSGIIEYKFGVKEE
jgi:hypothetical protein